MACASFTRLRRESEGAILVMGVAMGLLMVGALWNIVSIGDAIIWRERLQDAADAAAFENAVWNARGMNIIVFLNIVMSAAMAILVVLRGIIIFSSALLAALYGALAACAFAWFPSGITQALCALGLYGPRIVQPVLNWAVRTERNLNPRVRRFIRGVQTAQDVVATAAPVIGVKESSNTTMSEYDVAAVGLSPSLLPTSGDRGARVGRLPRDVAERVGIPNNVTNPDLREDMPRIGRFVSLPVSLDGEWKLCKEAGEFVPNELFAALEGGGIVEGDASVFGDFASWLDWDMAGGFIRNVAGGIAGSLPSVFCGDMSPNQISELTNLFRQVAQDNCNAAEHAGRVTTESPNYAELRDFQRYWERRDVIIVDPNGEADAHSFNREACERDQIARQNRELAFERNRGAKPARVWRYTMNGDFFMQSWGASFNLPARLERNDRGLTFPERGAPDHLLEANVWALGTAQAEMYHDCSGSWEDCQEDAMWIMRWKARLRRVQNPTEMVERSVAQIAMTEVINAVHQVIQLTARNSEAAAGTAIGNSGANNVWTRVFDYLRGNMWDQALMNRGNQFGLDLLGTGAEQTVGSWLAASPPPANKRIIH